MHVTSTHSGKRWLLVAVALIVAASQFSSASVQSTFEIDGNVTKSTTHDWDQVFAGNPPGAVTSVFLPDPVNSRTDDIFKGGGSKDGLGIQQGPWLSSGGKPEPPNDIADTYAAMYTDPASGHLLLYAGMDRFDHSEPAIVSFWLLQDLVEPNLNVTTNGGHPFTGHHRDGDVLITTTFTVAGSTPAVNLFRWTGDDATGQPVSVNAGSAVAIVNSAPIQVPWSFKNKKGATGPAAGEFLEAGLDLSAAGLDSFYFTFIAATRSSAPTTSTVSDYAIGTIARLDVSTFSGLSKVGDPAAYPLTITNTTAIPLYVQNVTDTLLGNIVVNHVLQAPGAPGVSPFVTSISAAGFDFTTPLAPEASLTVSVTRTVQSGDPDPTLDTVSFVLSENLPGTEGSLTASGTNTINLFQPSATLTVTASPTTATALGTPITYTYNVINTSSADSPNLVLSTSDPNNFFLDSLLGNLEAAAIAAGGGSLAPGGSFSFTEIRAVQAGDPSPLGNTANVTFTLAQDKGSFSNTITAGAGASVTLVPHLTIAKAVTGGGPNVIHPGDTASFTITVTNDGAGPATHLAVTDQLPRASLLSWGATSSTFTTSVSLGGRLTGNLSSLAAGASATVTLSAVVPLDVFPSSGTAGDSLPLNLFELDGNAASDVSANGEDWSDTLAGAGSAIASNVVVTDVVNSTADDIFTGGGSKDTLSIQAGPWLFTNSKPQAKDDVSHAFAAVYRAPNGDMILYTGMDRFDNSGDSTAGFWLFRNAIGKNSNVAGHPFTGTHSDGDVLLVSDFTVGGSTSTIKVFKWSGDDATGSLVALNSGNPISGSTFAIVNSSTITLPWPYVDKSRTPNNQALQGEFLEQGVNLSGVGLAACFSSFLAETRSSQSPTATLSDFAIGSLLTCNIALANAAAVQADGIPQITSNTATINVVP